jgi:hypothetical protein
MHRKIVPLIRKSKASRELNLDTILDTRLFSLGFKSHQSGYWIFAAVGVTWLPLGALAFFQGGVSGSEIQLSFLRSISVHIRFLFALPILIAVIPIVSAQISAVVRRFFNLNLISPSDLPKVKQAVDRLIQVNKTIYPDLFIIALIFFVHLFRPEVWMTESTSIWKTQVPVMRLWYEAVSLPIYQFLTVKWFWSFVCWVYFLKKVASSNLNIAIGNPDRLGGLGFMTIGHCFFSLVLFAFSSVFASHIAEDLMVGALNRREFYTEVGTYSVLTFIFVLFIPFGLFIPKMAKRKKAALLEYGAFCSRYVKLFDRKWIEENHLGQDDQLLGTSDIQALADLDGSVVSVRETRVLLVNRQILTIFALAILLPLFPLLLFEVPLEVIFRIMSKVLM